MIPCFLGLPFSSFRTTDTVSLLVIYMMGKEKKELHIAMFPWLAFGHMLPYLSLAKLIASKGHFISFISTRRNIDRLPKPPPNLSSQITFIEFTLPPTHGLPEGAEATSDLPLETVSYLKASFDKLGPQLSQFLETCSPDWLVHDFSQFWAGPIASSLGIPSAFFSIFMASSMSLFGPPGVLLNEERNSVDALTGKPKWVPFDAPMPPLYAAKRLMENNVTTNASGASDAYRIAMCVRNCQVVAVRGSYEVEPEWLKLLQEIYERPVIPIGHLPPVTDKLVLDEVTTSESDPLLVMEFLNGKPNSSVVYVAFGSEATVTQQELTELAFGLEISGLPFIWVLKKAQEVELPHGFIQRTGDRGLVYTDWAPQLKILSHQSVGGFLTHNGWTSVVESICLRKPMILLPLHGEQLYTVNVLEQKKLGYAVPRDQTDGSFTRDAVAQAVRLVVMEEDGRVFREKVKEMSAVFGDHKRQNEYVDEFIEFLRGRGATTTKNN